MSMVRTEDRGNARVIVIDNPPVNALSFALSAELLEVVRRADADPSVDAVIFTGAGGVFSGGADVNDFTHEPTPETKTIRDVIAAVERSDKTFVAAIDGNALGGGLELSLACDYRVATPRSKVGLPEIRLGLLPGAGGTQRLPRLIGAQEALQMMLKGESVPAPQAKEKGILDEVVEGDVVEAALKIVADVRSGVRPKKRRVSERSVEIGAGIQLMALPFVVAQAHKMVPPEDRGGLAAHKIIDAVQAAFELPFARGLAREFRLFDELVRSAPSLALRHIFFAERELSKIPGLPPERPDEIRTAGVIGAGTMGTGIAICFADAGIPVTVVEPNDEQVEKAKQMVFGMYMHQVQRGRLSQEEAWTRGQSIVFTDEYERLADCDVVVEAVFENLDVKKEVFAKLDAIVKPEGILASNTSTLDIDAMAAVTKRPEKVLGLHFFAPANIMKLLEIVRGAATSPRTLVTAFALGKKLRKVAVLSANAFGFIGNRMLFDYAREAVSLAEEGVPITTIDAAIKDFGFPMGPFAMFDLSGIDVFWHIKQAKPEFGAARTAVVDRLVAMKRLGQKTGAGFYKYDPAVGKGREPIPDPEVDALFAEEAAKAGIARRTASADEIVQRLVYALVNAGAGLLARGVALRPGDIDIVYVYGYGFPPHHGGPMWYADEVGLPNVLAAIERFRSELGPQWEPEPLLVELARSGGTFASYLPKEFAHA
jgi:3-hydroxyacyl-CoA dehydrogenase